VVFVLLSNECNASGYGSVRQCNEAGRCWFIGQPNLCLDQLGSDLGNKLAIQR
jgi:hypothetical protein